MIKFEINVLYMKVKLLIVFILLNGIICAQNEKYPQYPNPVKIPISLSATFAELRSNAFHAGVDIRTQGVEGKEVFAVADGYISRIGVSPFGYGKVIYITHNDGYTTVYAHLSKFNKKISDYVKSKQYEDESFVQNIILDQHQFPIKRGDYLGLTGNSGSSGGPHLHYEIRCTRTQEPINPMYFGLKVKDTKKPVIKGIAFYPLTNSVVNNSDTAVYVKVNTENNIYYIDNPIIEVNGNIAFGINLYDQADGANNKNGAYSIELYAGNELVYSIVSDKYSYDETRYINSLIDYSYYVRNNERYIRTEIDDFNKLKLYEKRNGVITVNQGDTLQMSFVVSDYNKNISELNFTLIGVESPDLKPEKILPRSYYRIFNGESSEIYLDGFESKIPEYTFYRNMFLKAIQIDTMHNIYSDFAYQIGTEDIPMHNRMSVRLRVKEEYRNDSLIYIASVDKDGKFIFLGNEREGDFLEAKTNLLGIYFIAKDSIKPLVKPLNFKNKGSVAENWSLRLEIDDKETGISQYAMYINDKWVLADYDAKNKLLMYQIDHRLKTGHNVVKVVVSDMVGNETVYSAVILR